MTTSIVSKRLHPSFQIAHVFERLAHRPGCLWLDSASDQPRQVSRYSFLCSDPTETLVASAADPCDAIHSQTNPWNTLARWCRRLPAECDPSLPPFQGGIAGMIGYEAGTWLDETGPALAAPNDDSCQTPAFSLGWYPWTIAVDHHQNEAWIIAHTPSDLDVAQSLIQCPPLPASSPTRPTSGGGTAKRGFQTDIAGVTSNFSGDGFRNVVRDVVDRIRAGDSFQVNLSQRLTTTTRHSPSRLYLSLRQSNPAPFAAYFCGGSFQVLSSSPEGFLRVRRGHVHTRPIKGTVARGPDQEANRRLASQLVSCEKNRAENMMIVDLMRNDLSRVCTDDSVVVTQLCQLEPYQFVQHLVSVVEGDLANGHDVVSLLRACFPGGSVTGAPKIEAMKTISQLEPHPRGPYCGSIGYISTSVDADFNILIRTMTMVGDHVYLPVGGGITACSDASEELAETWTKARGMLAAVGLGDGKPQ